MGYLGATLRTLPRQVKQSQRGDALLLSHPPGARPGESRSSGGRRRRGFQTSSPLSVTVVAVTGAVNAVTGAVTGVTWGRDPALDVTGTVPVVIAAAG
jgi:hypothetical protein